MTCATHCAQGSPQRLQALNESCACMPIDIAQLQSQLAQSSKVLSTAFAERPVLFAATPVFMCAADVDYMSRLIGSIEETLHTPEFIALLKNRAFNFNRPATPGMFTAYDFHIALDGPKLIEINTNAGGGFLVQDLYVANASTPPVCGGHWGVSDDADWMYQMLIQEWCSAGLSGTPKIVAIVDDAPDSQFLRPDFVLAQHYFSERGIEVVIADPDECSLHDGQLLVGGRKIDLVYNRLTDFYLIESRHQELRQAWDSRAVLFSPAPDHHAMFADKRNLIWLSDPESEMPWVENEFLRSIPRVQPLNQITADRLWQARKKLFYKPAVGFAGKGAYRGAKLSKRVWQEMLQRPDGSYVAQDLVMPSSRLVGDGDASLKYDVRAYTYNGEIKMLAARMYHGQTTNFRTPGGGFAPVVVLP